MGAEIDPPLTDIVKKKHGRRFASVRHGLDPAQVDDYLTAIVSRIEALETELREDREAAGVAEVAEDLPPPPPAEDPSAGDTKGISRLAAVGEREVARMRAEAKAEAAAIVSDATREAERIRKEAESDAMRSVEEARAFLTQVQADAEAVLADVAERRRKMMEELAKMQGDLLNVAQELDLMVNPVGLEAPVSPSGRASRTR